MSYATLDDLKQRLGSDPDLKVGYEQLTDRTGGTTADDAVGQEVLDAAHGDVNGWIAKRYAVPVDVSSDATLAQKLEGITLDIAMYRAFALAAPRITVPERVADIYADAIKWLVEVAKGKATLPGATEIPAATIHGPSAAVVGHEARFTEDSMKSL